MGRGNVSSKDVLVFMEYLKEKKIKILPDEVIKKVLKDEKIALKNKPFCALCTCNKGAIVVRPSQRYLIDIPGGVVKVGDQGLTKVYKDGIGGAVQAGILAAEGIANGDLQMLQKKLEEAFPRNDYLYAQAIMGMNDLVLPLPFMPKLLSFINRNHIPLISHLMEVYMDHLLTGDIPYKQMIPLVHYIIDPFLKSQ